MFISNYWSLSVGMNWELLSSSAGQVLSSVSSEAACSAVPSRLLFPKGAFSDTCYHLHDRYRNEPILFNRKSWSQSYVLSLSFSSQSQVNYIYNGAVSHSHISSYPRGQAKSANQRPPPDYSSSSRTQHFDKNAYVWGMWINTYSWCPSAVLKQLLYSLYTIIRGSSGSTFWISTCFFRRSKLYDAFFSFSKDVLFSIHQTTSVFGNCLF